MKAKLDSEQESLIKVGPDDDGLTLASDAVASHDPNGQPLGVLPWAARAAQSS